MRNGAETFFLTGARKKSIKFSLLSDMLETDGALPHDVVSYLLGLDAMFVDEGLTSKDVLRCEINSQHTFVSILPISYFLYISLRVLKITPLSSKTLKRRELILSRRASFAMMLCAKLVCKANWKAAASSANQRGGVVLAEICEKNRATAARQIILLYFHGLLY